MYENKIMLKGTVHSKKSVNLLNQNSYDFLLWDIKKHICTTVTEKTWWKKILWLVEERCARFDFYKSCKMIKHLKKAYYTRTSKIPSKTPNNNPRNNLVTTKNTFETT